MPNNLKLCIRKMCLASVSLWVEENLSLSSNCFCLDFLDANKDFSTFHMPKFFVRNILPTSYMYILPNNETSLKVMLKTVYTTLVVTYSNPDTNFAYDKNQDVIFWQHTFVDNSKSTLNSWNINLWHLIVGND